MSKPAPGTYYIINRVLSPTGDKLAITSNGQGKTVTLTPMKNLPSQQVLFLCRVHSGSYTLTFIFSGSSRTIRMAQTKLWRPRRLKTYSVAQMEPL